MNPVRAISAGLLLVAGLIGAASAQTPFSGDSAAAVLRVIAGDIGPRPMGSPAEQQAMEYGLSRFRSFGLETRLMRMEKAGSEEGGRLVNTRSGAAVGILHGKTGRMIVIGGHIDSASPEVPGANDDGSGAATVIELARVLSMSEHQSTFVFCLFGGEEQGLRGSEFFVDNFPEIDSVALMLQVDMANGSDWMIPLVDVYGKSAPPWLVRAAYEEYAGLGYSDMVYPTAFLTLNNLTPSGGIGSDHMPFLRRDIPAMDFTSDMNDPIHTPQDNLTLFRFSGLKRSGDLIYRLAQRYDGGVPPEKTARYTLYDLLGRPYFVPPWVLNGIVLLSLIVAGYSVVRVRPRRTEIDRAARPKVPGLKLFLLMLIIQSFAWLSENVVSLVKGDRFPWLSDLNGYYLLGFLAALVGIHLSLRIAPALRLSADPYRWHLRAVVWLTILTLLFALVGGALAFYPAFALLCISLALLSRVRWLQFVFWLLAPYPMFRLGLSDGWPLFARSLVLQGVTFSSTQDAVLTVVLILLFALWSFPFLLSFAAVHTDTRTSVTAWMKSGRARWITAGAAGLWALVLAFRPTFSESWNQQIRIDQTVDLTAGATRGRLRSAEYLKGAALAVDGRDTVITSRTQEVPLFDRSGADSSWIMSQRTVSSTGTDSIRRYEIVLNLTMKARPYTLAVTYSSDRHSLDSVDCPLATTQTSRSVTARWYSFPDSMLSIPIAFTVHGRDTVTESIEATFVQQAVPVRVSKEHANVMSRTVVRRSTVIAAP